MTLNLCTGPLPPQSEITDCTTKFRSSSFGALCSSDFSQPVPAFPACLPLIVSPWRSQWQWRLNPISEQAPLKDTQSNSPPLRTGKQGTGRPRVGGNSTCFSIHPIPLEPDGEHPGQDVVFISSTQISQQLPLDWSHVAGTAHKQQSRAPKGHTLGW